MVRFTEISDSQDFNRDFTEGVRNFRLVAESSAVDESPKSLPSASVSVKSDTNNILGLNEKRDCNQK